MGNLLTPLATASRGRVAEDRAIWDRRWVAWKSTLEPKVTQMLLIRNCT